MVLFQVLNYLLTHPSLQESLSPRIKNLSILIQLERSNARVSESYKIEYLSLFLENSLTKLNENLEYRNFYCFKWNFLFISTYDELGSMGVDFGRLLENQAKTDEKSSRPPSAPVSRSNSRTASITSLSSFMTNETSKQEPDEVILTYSLIHFLRITSVSYLTDIMI